MKLVASLPDARAKRLGKRCLELAARTRVRVLPAVALAAVALARPTAGSVLAAAPLAVAGLLLRAWAAGHLRKGQALAASGPYAYVRNPLYLGSLLAGLGLGVATGSAAVVVAIALVFLVWHLPVVWEEEAHLRKIIPDFRAYEGRVPRFVPSLVPRCSTSARFDRRLYVRNREYLAFAAFAAFALLLWVKGALLR